MLAISERPRWSVMIPSYNCATYLEQCLLSILQQDPGESMMQIEVVDDRSIADDPEEVVKRVGKGRVSFYRQPVNVGATRNFNTCVERAKGELVHILHGDDWVRNGFYDVVSNAFITFPEIGIAITGCSHYDEKGNFKHAAPAIPGLLSPSNKIEDFLYSNPIRPAATVIKKKVYESIGAFDDSFFHCADWDMWVRAISNSWGLYIPKDLGCYRVFKENDTSKLILKAENIRDYEKLYYKFKKNGYPITDKKISLALKEIFLHQYANMKELKLKKSISIYKREMHKYLTVSERVKLIKQELVQKIKPFLPVYRFKKT